MDRRTFLKYSATGLVGLSLPFGLPDAMAKKAKDGRYNIVILGDTHYDDADPERYHAGYTLPDNPKREEAHRKEFVRNGKMWSGRCQGLVKRAACLVDDDTRYIFQMGDLIQGDTVDAETHKRFLEDAMNLFKKDLAPELPFVSVVGNHDVRGNNDAVAAQAYVEYMSGRMSQELGMEITGNNYLFRQGPDAFIVIDFTKPDVPAIERMLSETADARHTFVLVHSPVFPYDDAKYFWWFLLGGRKDPRPDDRRHVRRLLAERNAIVLCGHVHTTEFLDWYGDGGRITQMTMSSVWSYPSRGIYKEVAKGKDEYGTLLFAEKPKLRTPQNEALFAEYREGIRAYSMSDTAGSYKLTVDGNRVYVDFYAGDDVRRAKRFILR